MTTIGYLLSVTMAVLCAVCAGYGLGRRERRAANGCIDEKAPSVLSGHLLRNVSSLEPRVPLGKGIKKMDDGVSAGVTPSAADGGSSPKVELRDDEMQLRKEKQLQRDFEIISGYNLHKALERRNDR